MKLCREEVFTGINLPNLSIDPFISLKVAAQLFEPEIRLCAKEPSSKHMSQSVEYKNYFRYQIVCSCQPGPRCIKLFAGVFYGKNQETPAKKMFPLQFA